MGIRIHPVARADRGGESFRARLQVRRPEMEQAMLARSYGISDPTDLGDPQYIDGLRTTVSAAIDYALTALESGEENAPTIPSALLTQARLAAQNGITLDIVLRRYVAGFTLLSDFILQEVAAHEPKLGIGDLRSMLNTHAALLDRLLDALCEEHRRAAEELEVRSSEQRMLERVRRILDGELLDGSAIDYPFDGWHLGMVGTGLDVAKRIRSLTVDMDCRCLFVSPDETTMWAWLSARHHAKLRDLADNMASHDIAELYLAMGEPGRRIDGWRLTHRQAAAAMPVALRGESRLVRYADVVLLSTIVQNDLLALSLRQLYLAPLERDRDRGKAVKDTLRTYFATNQKITSAAAAMGVNRNTVAARIRLSEERIGRPIASCGAELEAALRMEELENANQDYSGRSI
jgi:hypothetical protein